MSADVLFFIIYLLGLGLYVYTVGRVLIKAGLSQWWCVLSVIPIVNVIGLFVFVRVGWPNLPNHGLRQSAIPNAAVSAAPPVAQSSNEQS